MLGALPGGSLTVPKTVIAAEVSGISTNTLTAMQKQVLAAKPVAKVKTVVKDQGSSSSTAVRSSRSSKRMKRVS